MLGNLSRYSKYLEYWPLLTFSVLFLGYISFYTYCSVNGITFVKPDLSLIVGLGLFNLGFLAFVFAISGIKHLPDSIVILFALGYIFFIPLHPLVIILLVLSSINMVSMIEEWTYDPNDKFNRKRIKVKSLRAIKKVSFALLILTVAIIIVFVENGMYYAILYFFVDKAKQLSRAFQKKKKVSFANLAMLLIFLPIFIAIVVLGKIDYTIFGLAQTPCSLYLTSKDSVAGKLVYKDDNYFYLSTDKNKITVMIPNTSVDSVKMRNAQLTASESLYKSLFPNK